MTKGTEDQSHTQAVSESKRDQLPLAAPERERFANLHALGHAALALFLYLLLVDVAVETFLGGPPTRWVVIAIISVYGAATILLWPRLGWTTKSSASFAVLLLLLGLITWLPQGTTEGIRLVGQPTSAVLSLFTAMAIVLAGLGLIRSGFLPRPVKGAAAFLAIYSTAAFLGGIVSGTSYPELFHGGSLWVRLPFWLQGAFIGVLILVPLMLFLQLMRVLIKRVVVVRRWTLETFALSLTLVIALAGLRTPPVSVKPRLSPEQAADRLEKIFPALEHIVSQLPRDRFEVQAILDGVGRDPIKLFEWVRDHTFLVPYQGVLRGPTGVLMDRLGNSIDRALLLHTLLHSAGLDVRLARGALTDEQAREMLSQVRRPPRDHIPLDASADRRVFETFLDQYARNVDLDAIELRKRFDDFLRKGDRIAKEASGRSAQQAKAIASALDMVQGRDATKPDKTELEAMRDHWWVQLRQSADWVDLDPTLPNVGPRKVLANLQETATPDRLPASLFHEIQIRVIIEQLTQGRVREQIVLDRSIRPLELYGTRITVSHIPMRWKDDSQLFGGKTTAQRLKTEISVQDEWMPVLRVGTESITHSSFTNAGLFNEKPLAPILGGSPGNVGRDIGDILGTGGIGSAPGREVKHDAHLTAEWIEYVIRSPGRDLRSIRREIFDLLGPARRSSGDAASFQMTKEHALMRGLALIGETEILPVVSQLPREFVLYLMAKNLLANRQSMLDFLRKSNSPTSPEDREQLSKIVPVPGILYSLALARSIWSPFRGDVYLDQPNVLTYHTTLRPNSDDELVSYEGFDIVANDVAVHTGAQTRSLIIRLEQGVLDTNAEALLMPRRGVVENTAEIFARSARKGDAWVAIRKASDRALQTVELPKDVRARIEEDLSAGNAVLVPRKAVHVDGRALIGWWRVNPDSGQALGIGRQGWGQTATDMNIFYKHVIGYVGVATCLAVKVANREYDRRREHPHDPPISIDDLDSRDWLVCGLVGVTAYWVPIKGDIFPWSEFVAYLLGDIFLNILG